MFRWFTASIALATTVATATAGFTVTVVPTVGPDVNNLSFGQFSQNAAFGLRAATDNGTVGNPNFYFGNINAYGGGALNFLSGPLGGGVTGLWQGVANPTGAFAAQTGNWVYFGLAIRPDGGPGPATFTPNDVNFDGIFHYGLDPDGFQAGSLGAASSFGYTDIGGVLTPIATNTTAVDNLYYVGFGYSLPATFGGGGPSNGQYADVNELNALMYPPGTPTGHVDAGYSLFGVSGAAGVDINGAPAPATVALMGLGLAGLVARVRRRKA